MSIEEASLTGRTTSALVATHALAPQALIGGCGLPANASHRKQHNDGDQVTDQMTTPASGARTTTSLPTLLRDGAGFRVYDPDLLERTEHTLEPNGSLTHRNATLHGVLCVLGIAAPAVLAPMLLSDGPWWGYVLWAVAGGVVGFLVVGFTLTRFVADPLEDYRKRRGGNEPFVNVDRDNAQAFRLCELAEGIAASDAWRRKVIDPDRLVAATLWSSASRAMSVATEQLRIHEAERTGASDAVLVAARDEIRASVANLDRVESNLREVRQLARELDARAALGVGAAALGSGARQADADPGVAASESILEQSRVLRELL